MNGERTRLGKTGLAAAVLLLMLGAIDRSGWAAIYDEAPELAARVASGSLPPIQLRLPWNPLLVEPEEQLGRYGGTWHMAMLGQRDGAALLRTIGYEPLVRWDVAWTHVIPGLAQSFEVSADQTIFTFHLRRGLRWSDGAPFTSADIRFWYEDVLANPQLTPTPPFWLTSGGELFALTVVDEDTVVFRFAEPNRLFLRHLASADLTLGPTDYPRHRLMRYHPRYNPDGVAAEVTAAHLRDWVELFRLKSGSEVSRSDLAALRRETLGPSDAASGLAASGPIAPWPTLGAWIVDALVDGNPPQLVATRNPFYWKIDPVGRQLPYIDHVVYYLLDSPERLHDLVLAGKLDLQLRHINAVLSTELRDIQRQAGYRLVSMTPSDANSFPLMLNMTHPDPARRALFANRDFRIALSHAINRWAVIGDSALDGARPYQVAPRPTSRFYDKRLAHQYLEYDPALANSMLDQIGLVARDDAGFRLGLDGKKLEIRILLRADRPDRVVVAGRIVDDWAAVGVKACLEVVDRSVLQERVRSNSHDAVDGPGDGGLTPVLQPAAYVPSGDRSWYGVAWARWFANPEDPLAQEPPEAAKRQAELYEQIGLTTDRELQNRLAAEFFDLAAEQFYAIGISQEQIIFGIIKPKFHNVPPMMINSWLYPNPAPSNPSQYYIGVE